MRRWRSCVRGATIVALVVVLTLGVAAPLACPGAACSSARAGSSATLPRAELVIESAGGVRHGFEVEVAATSAARTRGLMYRSELAPDSGMLFVFENAGPVAMWMKNTFISLDMLFIANDGRIVRIAERTTPLSRKTIASGGAVRAVLELAGGSAARLAIRPGDLVRSPALPLAE
jgi:uncharacterized membrane protein (UPF0127 family)